MSKNLFFIALILAASGLVSPPIALLGGLIYGFTVAHPFHVESKRLAKFLLQASVVALGFGMNLHEVLHAGSSGFLYTAASITLAMLLGLALGHLIHVGKKSAFLISAGTAICGGSAIAAVGPIANANEEEMAVSMGTVFILNSVALFLFPWHEPGAVRHLVSAGDSRYQFCSGRQRKIRRYRFRDCHHHQAGTLSLDRSSLLRNGSHLEIQSTHSVALVHFALLPCRFAELVVADVWFCFWRAQSPWENRLDGDAVLDWDRPKQRDT